MIDMGPEVIEWRCSLGVKVFRNLFGDVSLAYRERDEILFRRFGRVSEYAPNSKREEWRGQDDCWGCPYWKTLAFLRVSPLLGREGHWKTCELRRGLSPKFGPLGDPSFCRFPEYRRILFRRFERVTT